MIETKVPKDIRKFKGKAVGPFTLRQVICGLAAMAVDFTVYRVVLNPYDVSQDTCMFVMIAIAVLILSFSFEPYGMKMEIYVRKVLYKNFFYPNVRKTETVLTCKPQPKSAEELAKINKEYKQRIKEEPEWEMFE